MTENPQDDERESRHLSFAPQNKQRHRRAVFSHDAPRLGSQIAEKATQADPHVRLHPRHTRADDELGILADIEGNAAGPVYRDATIAAGAHRSESVPVRVLSTVAVFCVSVIMGTATVAAVQALQKDTRRSVRQKLASQMTDASLRRSQLEEDIRSLQGKIEKQTDRLNRYSQQSALSESDEVQNASSPVQGPGALVTLSAPTQPVLSSGRVVPSFQNGAVTDLDLQEIKDLLWKSGAEALALNNKRLGPQTSIRHAGLSILVGTQAITPPYVFAVIGNGSAVADMINNGIGKSLVATFQERGITVTVTQKGSLTLPAVTEVASNVEGSSSSHPDLPSNQNTK